MAVEYNFEAALSLSIVLTWTRCGGRQPRNPQSRLVLLRSILTAHIELAFAFVPLYNLTFQPRPRFPSYPPCLNSELHSPTSQSEAKL